MTQDPRRISRPDLRVPHRPGRGRRRPVAACPVRSTAVAAQPPLSGPSPPGVIETHSRRRPLVNSRGTHYR